MRGSDAGVGMGGVVGGGRAGAAVDYRQTRAGSSSPRLAHFLGCIGRFDRSGMPQARAKWSPFPSSLHSKALDAVHLAQGTTAAPRGRGSTAGTVPSVAPWLQLTFCDAVHA